MRSWRACEPSDPRTEVGALVHPTHFEKVMSYVEIGKSEGRLVAGGGRPEDYPEGNWVAPTVFADVKPDARVFQEEIFGPVLAVTTFKDEAEALSIANDTMYGLGAGVWTRDGNRATRMSRGIQAGRIWVNCYHQYPAGAAFGGYKVSGIGRENHAMMLDIYSQTKAILVSSDEHKLGFF